MQWETIFLASRLFGDFHVPCMPLEQGLVLLWIEVCASLSPPNSDVETLIPCVMVFGGGDLEVTRSLG